MVLKRAIAEGIGTFFLVLVGTGAILLCDAMEFRWFTDIGIGLAFGVTVTAVILAIGKYSGAHINPAVTLGFWYDKQISGSHVLPYIISQCLGAIAASFTLALLDRDHPTYGGTVSDLQAWQTFTIEFLITAILMFVILRTTKLRGILIPALAVGGIVTIHASAIGPYTGASMNPARTLGPAIASGQIEQLGLYICATVLGSLFAAVLHRKLFKSKSAVCPDAPNP